MITRIKNGRLITPAGIAEKSLYIKNGKIIDITEKELKSDKEIDADGKYVAPGFIDIHVHGGGGHEFVDGSYEAIKEAANIHARHGTTTIYPTISAYDNEKTEKTLDALRAYRNCEEITPHIYGAHLEGPYFSPKQSGAQDPSFIRTPNKEEYGKLYNKYSDVIARWSYAPELDGAEEFLNFLNKTDVVVSAGHTDAEYSDIKKAYENGMKLITHLYSCTSTIKRKNGFRILGVTEAAYLYDDIDVETIADGCHLPPELLALIYKIKGEEHMCLVTDSIRYGGSDGNENAVYADGNVPYIIEDGVAKLADRSAFAGSIATSDILIRTCVKKAGIPLKSAVKMMTEIPARIMKLKTKGKLQIGYDADIVIFDESIIVREVLVSKGVI